MQIKKGPYGYYAIEKFDSPDILSIYAEEVIAGNRSDFYIKPGTESIGTGAMCYFEFSGYMQITDPEFSVFSPGKKITPNKKEIRNLNLRRRSAGDLFYSFVKLLDHLISPSSIVLDPDMIFTDPEGITLKLCCLPIKSSPEDLCLSALGVSRLEKLLNCSFFKSIISDDEINALVYSVKENNEEMFLKIAGIIRGTDDNSDSSLPVMNDISGKTKNKTARGVNRYSKAEMDLMISCLSAFLSFVTLVFGMLLPCFLFFFLTIVILAATLLNQKKREEHVKKAESQEKSRQRSSILFSEDMTVSDNDLFGNYETPETANVLSVERKTNIRSEQFNLVISGRLNLIGNNKGVASQYTVYLDETYIGSDCFLSDIVLDDPAIAPLHAVIRQKDGTFYLEPAKGSGKTYLEDSPVENGRSYEIKSGQKITVGNIEFRFSTNEANKLAV